jgi:AcrR family transcriptional regulator
MIRYYFGNRQGLVDEVLARRFNDRFGEYMGVFAEATRKCSTSDEFRAVVEGVLSAIFVPERTQMRLERNSDVGEAIARPELAAKIAAERDEVLGELRAIIADAQARGLMKKGLDPAVVAGLHLSMVHGHSIFELGERSIDAAVFRDMYAQALFALIFD